MRFISISTYSPASRLPTEAEMASMHKFIVEGMKAGWLLECEGVTFGTTGVRVHKAASGEVTVTDGPFAETKEVLGGYALLSAASMEEAVEYTRRFLDHVGQGTCEGTCEGTWVEPGRPTSFTRWRREKDSSFSEPDFQRKFRRKCRIQVDWLFSSCRHRHDPQPRTPATKSSIAVLLSRLDETKRPSILIEGPFHWRVSTCVFLLGSMKYTE